MITNTTAKSVYTITSGVTSYPIGFAYQYNPDNTPQIKVYIKPHIETPLIYGTDYTISLDGLSVVLIGDYEPGEELVIVRNIYNVQLSDYVIGRIDPEQIEKDFDEAVMRDQQLQAEVELIGEMPLDHEARITEIENVIPSEASPTNQLADKNFVATSIVNATKTYVFEQAETADTWNVVHNLNKYPCVVVVDTAGSVVQAAVRYVSLNECEIKFNVAFKGYAYLN
jgi:hypothetical protein